MCHRNKTVSVQSRKHTTQFNDVFTFSDMQFGFKEGSGCSHAIFLLCEVIDYFASHGSTVYMATLDARKAFDRVNHVKLFNLLLDNNVFSSVISVHSLSVCLSVFSILC